MSEDETIDKINYMINNWHRNVVEIDIQWIQGLLDLYKQEKQKNKELENADLTIVYMNGFYEGENKWKDKIRAKIEKLKKLYNESEGLQGDVNILYHIGYLKELLKEN